MSKYFIGLEVHCDVKGCAGSAIFQNPTGLSGADIWDIAIEAGWYVTYDGLDRCPKDHTQEAGKHGKPSLYVKPVLVSVPTPNTLERAKRKKRDALLPSL